MRFKLTFLISLLVLTACNKPVVQGKVRPISPLTRSYSHATPTTFEATRQALTLLGYQIRKENPEEGRLQTEWRSTTATSHYTEVFDQKDFGTVGTYYRLEIQVREKGNGSEVEVAAPVKSLVAHQKSTSQVEKKLLKKVGDLLRGDDFEMTNVGTE